MASRATQLIVHKFEIGYGQAKAHLPKGAEILYVDTQPTSPDSEAVFAWALVDPNAAREPRQIGYFATGDFIPVGAEYVGTAVTPDKTFVWHVFAANQGDHDGD